MPASRDSARKSLTGGTMNLAADGSLPRPGAPRPEILPYRCRLLARASERGGRFIPARAGNTSNAVNALAAAPVHPRSRGEHGRGGGVMSDLAGSSPLARGTHRSRRSGSRSSRFIPARAGNTAQPGPASPLRPVHPRSRGEHGFLLAGNLCVAGSSPLARGTQQPHRQDEAERRFIPARAGNTHLSRHIPDPNTVHPRSRGEHEAQDAPDTAAAGSSPLARGTRPSRGRSIPARRFIPARAGNTRGTHPRG